MENIEGKKVPEVVFKTRVKGQWQDLSTKDIFAGKKVIVFSLPGAYTPTCSSTHLPRYNDLAPIFKEEGIDEVYCLSVNDTFVMNAWQLDEDADNIKMIPDGNGEFSAGIGMLVDKSAIGFGKRSWRYSMVVNDGVVEKAFIEEEKPGDPFEVSDADTMMKYIAPNRELPVQATVFTRVGCPHCVRAKEILTERKIPFNEVLGQRPSTLQSLGGTGTYPLVFFGGKLVGGADDLEKFFK